MGSTFRPVLNSTAAPRTRPTAGSSIPAAPRIARTEDPSTAMRARSGEKGASLTGSARIAASIRRVPGHRHDRSDRRRCAAAATCLRLPALTAATLAMPAPPDAAGTASPPIPRSIASPPSIVISAKRATCSSTNTVVLSSGLTGSPLVSVGFGARLAAGERNSCTGTGRCREIGASTFAAREDPGDLDCVGLECVGACDGCVSCRGGLGRGGLDHGGRSFQDQTRLNHPDDRPPAPAAGALMGMAALAGLIGTVTSSEVADSADVLGHAVVDGDGEGVLIGAGLGGISGCGGFACGGGGCVGEGAVGVDHHRALGGCGCCRSRPPGSRRSDPPTPRR